MKAAVYILLEALAFYKIEVESVNGNHVKTIHNHEIEVESEALYKLTDDGYVVGPFTNLDVLCRFILAN